MVAPETTAQGQASPVTRRPASPGIPPWIFQFAVVSTVLIVCAVGMYIEVKNLPKPRLQASETYYDFGSVSPSPVSHSFILSNKGSADLTILNLWTSCGCTSTRLIAGGMESPDFGTKGDSVYNQSWQVRMHPGDTAQLVVNYNPAITNGYFQGTRIVFIESNDPAQQVLQITIAIKEIP